MRYLLLVGYLALLSPAELVAQDSKTEPVETNDVLAIAKASVKDMRGVALVDGKTVELTATGPLYTFVDPSRAIASGTVWVWGTEQGRPSAVMSLATLDGMRYHEFHSFSENELAFQVMGKQWRPPPAWQGLEIPNAPPPHESSVRRLSQMKQIVERFRSSEDDRYNGRTSPMRILPQPIYRYLEPTREVDGAVFIIVRDGDPEAELILETKRNDDGSVGWQFMAGTMTVHDVTVFLDEKPFKLARNQGANEPYFIARRVAAPNEK